MRIPPRLVPVLLTAGLTSTLVLTACADRETSPAGSATSSTDQVASSPASGTPGDEDAAAASPFPADTEPDTEDASSDSSVTVADIRIGRHDEFDRVVFELGGSGTPGWNVRYVDEASSQGSGAAVPVTGEAILQVTLTGVGYPYDTGIDEFARGSVTGEGTEVVREVIWDATFEGTSVAFVGTAAANPFRVYALSDPARVVLEVAHSRP